MTSQHGKAKRWQFGMRTLIVIVIVAAANTTAIAPLVRYLASPPIENIVGKEWLPPGWEERTPLP